MDTKAAPARVTKDDALSVVASYLKYLRDGHGGHVAIVADGRFSIAATDIKQAGVFLCAANSAHKSSRLENCILDAVQYRGARRLVN